MTDGQCHRKERIKATCKTDLILSTTSTGCILFKKFLTDASFVQRMQLYISSSRSLSLSVSVPLSLCISHHKPMPPPPSPSLFHHLFRSGFAAVSTPLQSAPTRHLSVFLSVYLSVGMVCLSLSSPVFAAVSTPPQPYPAPPIANAPPPPCSPPCATLLGDRRAPHTAASRLQAPVRLRLC